MGFAAATRPEPQPTKSLVTQARLLWLFARLASGEQPAARQGSTITRPAGAKLTNTHLHLLEALAEYVRASDSLRARQRLLELITILGNTLVRQELGACTDQHRRDWTPILSGGGALVSYGHDLETIWLDLYGRLFDYSYRHGWDGARGSFFYSGGFHRKAQDRRKVWLLQAEALMSSLTLFRLTGEARYVQVFE